MNLKLGIALLLLIELYSVESFVNPCKKGLRTVQFLPHPESREKYIQCSMFGQAFPFTCPNGLIWNQENSACVNSKMGAFAEKSPTVGRSGFQSRSEVDQPLTTTTTTTTTTTMFMPMAGPVFEQGAFAVPSFTTTTTTRRTTTTTTTTTTLTTTTPTTTMSRLLTTTLAHVALSGPTQTFVPTSGACNTISIDGSSFTVVNGLYTKVNDQMYRRVDNLRLPGLIVEVSPDKWCISFTFSSHNIETLTRASILGTCGGASLDCCMLMSELPNAPIQDANRDWLVNILDNKGKKDPNMVVTCTNEAKICSKVPFCPPECLIQKGDCEVCECNGKPFFGIQSNILNQNGIVQTTTPVQPSASVQDQTPVQQMQPVQQFEPVQQMQPVQPVQQFQPVQSVQQLKPTQQFEQFQPIQPVQQFQPVQSVQQLKPTQQFEQFQPVQQVQQMQPVQQFQQFQQFQPVQQQLKPVQSVQQFQQSLQSFENEQLEKQNQKLQQIIAEQQLKDRKFQEMQQNMLQQQINELLNKQKQIQLNQPVQSFANQNTLRPLAGRTSLALLRPLAASSTTTTKNNATTGFVVNNCVFVKCPNGFVCEKPRDCDSCNPTCLQSNNRHLELPLTCRNTVCPKNFLCVESATIKCQMMLDDVQRVQHVFDLAQPVNELNTMNNAMQQMAMSNLNTLIKPVEPTQTQTQHVQMNVQPVQHTNTINVQHSPVVQSVQHMKPVTSPMVKTVPQPATDSLENEQLEKQNQKLQQIIAQQHFNDKKFQETQQNILHQQMNDLINRQPPTHQSTVVKTQPIQHQQHQQQHNKLQIFPVKKVEHQQQDVNFKTHHPEHQMHQPGNTFTMNKMNVHTQPITVHHQLSNVETAPVQQHHPVNVQAFPNHQMHQMNVVHHQPVQHMQQQLHHNSMPVMQPIGHNQHGISENDQQNHHQNFAKPLKFQRFLNSDHHSNQF